MGIERKKLSMGEKERLNTAIHESGHAITGYFNKDAMELYKATIIARGGALGVVSAKTNLINLFRLSLSLTNPLKLQPTKHKCSPKLMLQWAVMWLKSLSLALNASHLVAQMTL